MTVLDDLEQVCDLIEAVTRAMPNECQKSPDLANVDSMLFSQFWTVILEMFSHFSWAGTALKSDLGKKVPDVHLNRSCLA